MNVRRLQIFILLFCVLSGILPAQSDQKKSIPQLLLQWNVELKQSEQMLVSDGLDEVALNTLRQQLTEIRNAASVALDNINVDIGPVQEQLTALGPPPASDAAVESPSITVSRKTLNSQLADLEGQAKQTELVISQADDTLERLSVVRIHLFTKKIFSRGFSALDPEVWQNGIPELQEKWSAVKNKFDFWYSAQTIEALKREGLHLALCLLAILSVVWPFSRWFSRAFGRTPSVQIPNYVELLRAALAVAFTRSLLPVSIIASVYLLFAHDYQWDEVAQAVAYSAFHASVTIILVAAISRALLAPYNGRWRLMPLNNADAKYVHRVILGLAWVFGLDLVLDNWLRLSAASLELTILRQFMVGLLIAGLLLTLLLRAQLWRMDIQHRRKLSNTSKVWRTLRGLIAILVLLIPVSAIAGYVAFSRLLCTQIVLTGGIYILMSIIIALGKELIEELLSKETEIGLKIRQNLELTEETSELLVFWLKVVVNFVIYLGTILTLLVTWGAAGEDLNAWLYKALVGFDVGGVTISISTICFAIVLFSGILLLTRILQRFLEHVILPRTRLDAGIQNSIRASVGYIGFIIAAGVAISTLGIDLSKLAIIAGALSVGIGFGLQNVVNNFVSGLILLIERPIKVGDWVVVNDQQGYVKNINVRATEIQTFDRATVFIPNSNLISNPLLNWTHADKTGRVVIPIGVAYGTDTRKVQQILLDVANAHASVLMALSPSVLFKGFGDSCLNFELRAFVQDVDKVLIVSSDLCYEIDAAFRKEGIEIPFPQQDIHWRDMERLETLVSAILAGKKA